jgi:FdhD protein
MTDDWLRQKPEGEHPAVKLSRDRAESGSRTLANEVPVALEYDGNPYAVMMLTPADLEDFAVGFSLTERLVAKASDIARIDIRSAARGIAIDIRLEAPASARLKTRQRALVGQSGCGICGIQTLEEAVPHLAPLDRAPRVASAALFAALARLESHQPLNEATGAVHAAAFCQSDGRIVVVREDVGRHNALDKLIGHLARNGADVTEGFALLTSRCSYELVQKAVIARIPVLATISAPTELAVAIARETKLTLVALARADSMLVFNDPFGALQQASST